MDAPARKQDPELEAASEEPSSIVTSHETSPSNVVFTEWGNTDGWIATNLVVDLER